MRKKILVSMILSAVVLGMAACGTSQTETVDTDEQAGYETVTVDSCGRETTYEKPPEKAIVNDVNIIEMVLSLGVEEQVAGVTGLSGKEELLPELRDELEAVPVLTEEYLPGMEPILGADADFVAAGWNYGFTEESGITPESLAEFGIDSYAIGSRASASARDRMSA